MLHLCNERFLWNQFRHDVFGQYQKIYLRKSKITIFWRRLETCSINRRDIVKASVRDAFISLFLEHGQEGWSWAGKHFVMATLHQTRKLDAKPPVLCKRKVTKTQNYIKHTIIRFLLINWRMANLSTDWTTTDWLIY